VIDHDNDYREILEVRKTKRLTLCKILLCISIVFLLVFGLLSVQDGLHLFGGLLLFCMLVGCISLFLLHHKKQLKLPVYLLNGELMVLAVILLVTGGVENTGMLWLYPLLAFNIFINRFWSAVLLYAVFFVFSCLLLFTPLSSFLLTSYSLVESIRFEFSLLALYLVCLATLKSEERAYESLLQMYNDDIRQLAYFDALTELPNRHSFILNLTAAIQQAEQSKHNLALLYIDLDNFKQVNDIYGHEAGDRLLLAFSQQLKQVVRATDIDSEHDMHGIARLGGDEFVVMLENIESPTIANVVAQRILNIFEQGVIVAGANKPVCASIGISVYPHDATLPAQLLRYADLAVYEAKNKGRNRLEFYTQELSYAIKRRQHIESCLKLALEQDLLSLAYMPIFKSSNLELVAVEVLVRCQHLALDGIGPEEFIPVAEKSDLIKKIDLWVLEHSLVNMVKLQQDTHFNGRFSINISGIELLSEYFPSKVQSLLAKYHVAPSCIELEITETALVHDDGRGIEMLKQLRELGVSLALDDFGTGYTAFNQLVHYPVDCLKIDRSFVTDLNSEHHARNKMVAFIHRLANLYQLRVVAEGVETKKQLEYLQQIECELVQGSYLSEPLALQQLIELIGPGQHHLQG